MIFRILGGCGLALVLGVYAERANAGQVFLCEDGTSIEIAAADLEEAKRFDPCVARYFGNTVAPNAIPLPMRRPARTGLRADVAAVEKALRLQTVKSHKAEAPKAKAAKTLPVATEVVKTTAAAKVPAAKSPKMKSSQVPEVSALQRKLAALGAGDYRNVRVINGGQSSAWFRHER
jgi:hypothetical protein